MQANFSRGTRPETALRSALHRAGLRFRVDRRIDLADGRARPDIVFSRQEVAVFVDGCFWHGCPTHGSLPKTRQEYWLPKLAATKERDVATDRMLEAAGWIVIRVWEHEDPLSATKRVEDVVRARRASRA
jgi:DNA mismatch endonuclease (patch repair protein)